jgi:hypothetical protein
MKSVGAATTLVAKKKVAMTSVSSTEAFLMMGLALQLEVPMAEVSILVPIVGEECWNSGLDAQLEVAAASFQLEAVVAATSKSSWLWETLSTASRVLDPYENPVTHE